MAYIDCRLPRANKRACEDVAALLANAPREQGAPSIVDSWLDESGPDASTHHGENADPAARISRRAA